MRRMLAGIRHATDSTPRASDSSDPPQQLNGGGGVGTSARCRIFKWFQERLSGSIQPSFLGVGGAVRRLNAIAQDGKFNAECYGAPGRHRVEPVNQEQRPLLD